MASLKLFVRSFVKRGGILIGLSTFFGKFSSALLAIIVVRILTPTEYSDLAYLLSFYAILVVFAGIGGNYSLMRFGSISDSYLHKNILYHFALRKGGIYTIVFLIISIIGFYFFSGVSLLFPFIILSVSILSYYVLEVLKSYYRILELNHVYAKITTYSSIAILFLALSFTYFFNVSGYFIGMSLAPVVIFIVFSRRISNNLNSKNVLSINKKSFWNYGVHTSISAISNQIIFSIAPILIEALSTNKLEIGLFKVATIIPFNVLTLPGILMQTDFTALAKNSKSKKYLLDYYLNYLKIFGLITIPFFIVAIYFGDNIIVWIFGAEYKNAVLMYQIFMFATYFSYILRNPLGNILLAIGKAKWNGYNTYFFCAFYVVTSYIYFDAYGVYSFVYSLAFVFVGSGLVSLYMFYVYLRSL